MQPRLLPPPLWMLFVLLAGGPFAARAADYDPLAVPADADVAAVEWTAVDEDRLREIPLLVYLPPGDGPAPVILHSHGLGGSRNVSAFLGLHWAARGYVAVFLQHPGSDVEVWRDVPLARRMAALREAASLENFVLRAEDVPAVLDQLAAWNDANEHPLTGRLDLSRVGMSGHSFGAVTTQAVSGQSFPLVGQRYTDPRIAAAIPMSPSSPRRGGSEEAFGKVAIPWLLMTGTHDTAAIGDQTAESRLDVYPHLPADVAKYQLVLDGAEHSVFTERALPGERRRRNPNHHRVIRALSTAFWDAYLREDAAALAWLNGEGPRSVLEPADRWESDAGP